MNEARKILENILKEDFTDPNKVEVYPEVTPIDRLRMMDSILSRSRYPLPEHRELLVASQLRFDPPWVKTRGLLPEFRNLKERVSYSLIGVQGTTYLSNYIEQLATEAFIYRQPVSRYMKPEDLCLIGEEDGIFDPFTALEVELEFLKLCLIRMHSQHTAIEINGPRDFTFTTLSTAGIRAQNMLAPWLELFYEVKGGISEKWLLENITFPFAIKSGSEEDKLLRRIHIFEEKRSLFERVNSDGMRNVPVSLSSLNNINP